MCVIWPSPGDTRRLMDMRRSGVVGAIASGTDAVGLPDALWQGQTPYGKVKK
jgi:hypothetical protein